MWLSIEVMLLIGLIIGSYCLAESNGIKSNFEIATVRDTNGTSDTDLRNSIFSDSGQTPSENRGSDDSDIGRSESDSNSRYYVQTSDTGRSDSNSDGRHHKEHSTLESSYSDFEIALGRATQSHANDQLPSKDTSALRHNAIPEVPTSNIENERVEYFKDESDFSTPKLFQRNGRKKNVRDTKRRDRLRINKEEKDEKFFEPIRMPQKFEDYDHNRDGYISLRELIDVTGAVVNAKYAFSDSDNDNNGKIDEEEFQRAPWDLSGQGERSKHKKISSAE